MYILVVVRLCHSGCCLLVYRGANLATIMVSSVKKCRNYTDFCYFLSELSMFFVSLYMVNGEF